MSDRRNYPLGPCQEDILEYLVDNPKSTAHQISEAIGQISRAIDSARCCRRSVNKLVSMGMVRKSKGIADGPGRPRMVYSITARGIEAIGGLEAFIEMSR